jgi:acetyl esterase/lipase
VLIYPAIPSIGRLTPSLLQNGHSPILQTDTVAWFKEQTYSSWRDLYHPLACPINLANHLYHGSTTNVYARDDCLLIPKESNVRLPPAIVLVCELDLLRDEGLTYADLLRKSGAYQQ